MPMTWIDTSRSAGSRPRSRMPLVLFLLLLAGLGFGGYWFFIRGKEPTDKPPPTNEASRPPGSTQPSRRADATPGSPLPSGTNLLPGEQLLREGRAAEAIAQLRAFLERNPAGPDAARAHYLLAQAYGRTGQQEQAVQQFKACLETPYGADAALALGRLAEAERRTTESRSYYEQAWKKAPASRSGRLAAGSLADRLYAECVAPREDRARWEELWRLYSATLEVQDAARQAEVLKRLKPLAEYVVFDRGQPSPAGAAFHEVRPGDTLDKLAPRLGVPVGVLRLLNSIPRTGPRKDLINSGQKLKYLNGEISLLALRGGHRLVVFLGGNFIREYPAGFGKPEKPTPLGDYTVVSKSGNPEWVNPADRRRLPFGHSENPLGTRWIGFNDRPPPADGIGVHGSNPDGDGVPGNKSLGCIRLRNADVEELYDLVRAGQFNGTKARVVE